MLGKRSSQRISSPTSLPLASKMRVLQQRGGGPGGRPSGGLPMGAGCANEEMAVRQTTSKSWRMRKVYAPHPPFGHLLPVRAGDIEDANRGHRGRLLKG